MAIDISTNLGTSNCMFLSRSTNKFLSSHSRNWFCELRVPLYMLSLRSWWMSRNASLIIAFNASTGCHGYVDGISNMMTSSNGNIFRVTSHLCGEFTGHRWIPLIKASDAEFDVFFDLRLNTRLSKQSWGWWFETPSRPLWRHCDVLNLLKIYTNALVLSFIYGH